MDLNRRKNGKNEKMKEKRDRDKDYGAIKKLHLIFLRHPDTQRDLDWQSKQWKHILTL